MKDILRILLISLLSFTIISCSNKDESSDESSSGSSTSTDDTTIPIQLSDVNANLSGKSLFVTNESIASDSSRTINRSSEKSSTSTNSLLVIDNNSVADYGVLSNYELAIDQVRIGPDNKFAYIILEHDSDVFKADDGSTKDSTLISLNCGMIRVDLSNDAIDCVENGIVPIKRDNEWWYGENYALSSIQFASPSLFYLVSYSSGDNETYKTRTDLNCEKYCLYVVKNSIVEKLTSNDKETQAFYVFKSGSVAYYELTPGDPNLGTLSKETGIKYRDSEGDLFDITSKGGFFSGGDYKSIIKADDNETSNVVAISRVINNQIRRTYLNSTDGGLYFVKSNDGYIYAHGQNSLYSLLPFNNTALVSLPSNRPCDYGFTCSNYFKIHNKIAVYSVYTSTTKKEVYLYATDLGTDNTTTILKPNSDCSNNCYNLDKWYQNNNEIYVSLKNLNTNKYENILIDTLTIDFNKDNNQFEFMESIDEFMTNKKIVSVSSTNSINQNFASPTAEVKHIDNDTTSVRIEFNNVMNYSDVESKVSIVDNSSNNNIWFMPVWNNKTLHLVIDTDNGTVFDNNADPLTSGTTYKVTILGTSKDSDGNALGSDVVKYITP
jgi:hypothetical protein